MPRPLARDLALAAALALVACGPPPMDLSGTWSGNVIRLLNCGGDVFSFPEQTTLQVSQSDDAVSVTGLCGGFTADADESGAVVEAKACPDRTNDSGSRISEKFAGGVLTVSGAALVVAVNGTASFRFSDGTHDECTLTYSGTLTRK